MNRSTLNTPTTSSKTKTEELHPPHSPTRVPSNREMTTDAAADPKALESNAPLSPPSPLPPRPRISPAKAGAVALVLLLLTPLWLAYGLVGKVLTVPSRTLSRSGLAMLTLLASVVLYEVYVAELKHGHTFVKLTSDDDADAVRHEMEGERAFLQLLALLGFVLAALLVGQWRFHTLVMACLEENEALTTERGLRLLIDMLAPLFFVALLWEQIYALKHWQFVTGITIAGFALVFLLTPIMVAISHSKFWIPARYKELERIERAILKKNVSVPFEMLKVAGLGTVHVPCTSKPKEKKTLVLVHGFAAGNALWACNLEHLAKSFEVYAIEWVGTGRSDRPDFVSYEQEEADSIFVNAIEEWRKELKIDKFFLCGHSMGAMFTSSYAVRFPDRVEHLVLVSPAGVGRLPPPCPQPLGIKIFRFLWNLRLTPMSVIRYAGPFGPALLRFISSARVSIMPESSCIKRGLIPMETVAEYWYHNWALKSSGEIAMHSHLHPGVFARKPLCEMLTPATIKIPITFMYGGGPDWMDSIHGEKLAEGFEGHQRVQVLKVPLAGHQVFMDNVEAFNTMLTKVLGSST